MFFWLLLLFISVPILELVVLFRVGALIGGLNTIMLVIGTGILGAWLARREGRSTWRRLHRKMERGQHPSQELQDGFIILISGALLLTPGIMTDAIGFAGLFPPTRYVLKRWIRSLYFRQGSNRSSGYHVRWDSVDIKDASETSRTRDRSDSDMDYDIDVTGAQKKHQE